jgi:hypothetical protein
LNGNGIAAACSGIDFSYIVNQIEYAMTDSIVSTVQTYKRGQIVWAAWQAFSHHHSLDPRRDKIPTRFLTRVRTMNQLGVPLADKQKPGQPGIDIEYSGYHAFELAVALVCQDIGLKQAEVAALVQDTRKNLQSSFQKILASPPVLDGNIAKKIAASERPSSPKQIVVAGSKHLVGRQWREDCADTACFMAFRYHEMTEVFDSRRKSPLMFEPAFCWGLGELVEVMDWISTRAVYEHARIIIELSNVAVQVTDALKRAPATRRGRQ